MILPNSTNTSWIVCCVLWRARPDGIPDITHCDGHSYRSEDNAMERFDDLIQSFKERGYSIRKIKVPPRADYFGYSLRSQSGVQGVVYIDRNPVYRSH